ncbi:diguanylate cyclase (GGDEF)-like protein [Idiomarina fontislapidosi]|uniref:diguanylate cyclase n=1 Tax=Idiomarina fontislapidosi TaxID=263723 RepID=A0A432Y8Z7_9GAMM|nr:diguanylate cyclase [Idiomarina fontislapidosi]PYE34598.1 diguanylate cyclase (GGDEF)-like protein [Idiomarina fontislapidosi]RUO57448.1 sensor domain-containing diguanylate cyclase [Idiomarina fontislapidosi]
MYRVMRYIGLTVSWLVLWRVAVVLEFAPHASIWFPPAGLSFAALLVLGWRAVGPIAVAGFVSTAWITDIYSEPLTWMTWLTSSVLFVGAHTLPLGVGAYFVKCAHINNGVIGFPRTVLTFLVVSAISSLLTSLLGIIALTEGGLMSEPEQWLSWLPWWIGDMAGVMVLAPVFIAVLSWRYPSINEHLGELNFSLKSVKWRVFFGRLCLVVVLLGLSVFLVYQTQRLEASFTVFFIVLPFLWIATTASPLTSVFILALFSGVMALLVAQLQLQDFALVYQFAMTITAACVWFALSIPTLIAQNANLAARVARDGLTHAASRGYFLQRLEKRLRSNEANSPCCLIIFDFDHFKQINDVYGHIIGDHVLVSVTNYINQQLRENDMMGRFGGDEFMIMLPDTDFSDAQAIAKRLCAGIERLRIDGLSDSVSCSFGVVYCQPKEQAMSAIGRADRALLNAKKQGRCQVVACVA